MLLLLVEASDGAAAAFGTASGGSGRGIAQLVPRRPHKSNHLSTKKIAVSTTIPTSRRLGSVYHQKQKHHRTGLVVVVMSSLPAPYFAESAQDNNNNNGYPAAQGSPATPNAAADSPTNSSTSTSATTSLWSRLDDWGLALKPAAAQADARASALAQNHVWRRVQLQSLSCVLYALFIFYRAYRGLFVILPAVFRATFDKLKGAVDERPFETDKDDDNYDRSSANSSRATSQDAAPLKWRTRATISALAAIVTASYAVGGAVRIAATFLAAATTSTTATTSRANGGSSNTDAESSSPPTTTQKTNRRSLPQSLAAAAQEQERDQMAILAKTTTTPNNINNKTPCVPDTDAPTATIPQQQIPVRNDDNSSGQQQQQNANGLAP